MESGQERSAVLDTTNPHEREAVAIECELRAPTMGRLDDAMQQLRGIGAALLSDEEYDNWAFYARMTEDVLAEKMQPKR